MMQPSSPFPHPRRSAGAGLVTAIFLLVVLAGLAAALVSIFTTQRQSTALDEQGARAYQAARAGIEWALLRRATDAAYCATASVNGAVSAIDRFQLPAGTLAPFRVTVECWMHPGPASDNATVNLDRRRIRASACTANAGDCPAANNSADYVARVIEVQI